MTTPVASGTLYVSLQDLRDALDSTDDGTGTPSKLSDDQLTLALHWGSNRVSVYAGNFYDGTNPQAEPPPILHDLSLDLAVFRAWVTYLKGKVVPADHPALIAYQGALSILKDVRNGTILLDVADAPGSGAAGKVINRVPPVFTGRDSSTRTNPVTGTLEADVPDGMWAPMGTDWSGAAYQ